MPEDTKPGKGLNLNPSARPASPATPTVAKTVEPVEGERTTQRGVRLNVEDIEKGLDEGAAQAAVDRAGVAGSEGAVEGQTIYSSHPIPNFALGRFKFDNGVLKLDGEDLEEFEKLLNDKRLPAADRALIRKLDIGRVDAIVEARRAVQGGFDSSVGRAALERLHQDMPTVGTQDISHAKLPQMDNNAPVMPTDPVDPEGVTGLDQGPHTAPAGDQQTPPGQRKPVGDEMGGSQ